MSDDLDNLPERAAAEKLTEAKRRLAIRKMREKWAREGYDPRAHLAGMAAEGDRDVLVYMADAEYSGYRQLGAYMASRDIYEIVSRLHHSMEGRRTMHPT